MIVAVTDEAAGPESVDLITRLALLALLVYVVRSGFQFLRSYMSHVAGWSVAADVRQDVYQHLQKLSLRFYKDRQTGQLMSHVVNDSNLFERLIAHSIPDVMVNALMFVGVSAVLLSMNVRLTLLSMLPIPLVVLAMRGFARYVRTPERFGRFERGAQRHSFGHTRDQSVYPRGNQSDPRGSSHHPLS